MLKPASLSKAIFLTRRHGLCLPCWLQSHQTICKIRDYGSEDFIAGPDLFTKNGALPLSCDFFFFFLLPQNKYWPCCAWGLQEACSQPDMGWQRDSRKLGLPRIVSANTSSLNDFRLLCYSPTAPHSLVNKFLKKRKVWGIICFH